VSEQYGHESLREEDNAMKRWRISKQVKQSAFLGAAFFLAAQVYAFRELVFLGSLFSVAFWLVAGMVCVGLLIFEGVNATLARIGFHTAFEKVPLEPSIASTRTARIAGVKRAVELEPDMQKLEDGSIGGSKLIKLHIFD
jgi:hypothetical protein